MKSGLINHVCDAAPTKVMTEIKQLNVLETKPSAAKSSKVVHMHKMIRAQARTQASDKK